MGEMRKAFEGLVGTPEGKRSFGRPRLRWVDNIAMDLKERGWKVVHWIHLAYDRVQWWGLCEKSTTNG
jgi:hypothetical protein